MMERSVEVSELWNKIEQLRSQKLARRSVQSKRLSKGNEEVEQWRTRALVAEGRLADMEKLLESERAVRAKLLEEKGSLEATLTNERESLESRLLESNSRVKEEEIALRNERRRLRTVVDSFNNKIRQLQENLQQEAEARLAAESQLIRVEHQLEIAIEAKNEAIAEARVLSAKLHVIEREVLPKSKEDQARLESQIQTLRADLEDTIEAETAFRTLFLKEQSTRRLRRSQLREDMFE